MEKSYNNKYTFKKIKIIRGMIFSKNLCTQTSSQQVNNMIGRFEQFLVEEAILEWLQNKSNSKGDIFFKKIVPFLNFFNDNYLKKNRLMGLPHVTFKDYEEKDDTRLLAEFLKKYLTETVGYRFRTEVSYDTPKLILCHTEASLRFLESNSNKKKQPQESTPSVSTNESKRLAQGAKRKETTPRGQSQENPNLVVNKIDTQIESVENLNINNQYNINVYIDQLIIDGKPIEITDSLRVVLSLLKEINIKYFFSQKDTYSFIPENIKNRAVEILSNKQKVEKSLEELAKHAEGKISTVQGKDAIIDVVMSTNPSPEYVPVLEGKRLPLNFQSKRKKDKTKEDLERNFPGFELKQVFHAPTAISNIDTMRAEQKLVNEKPIVIGETAFFEDVILDEESLASVSEIDKIIESFFRFKKEKRQNIIFKKLSKELNESEKEEKEYILSKLKNAEKQIKKVLNTTGVLGGYLLTKFRLKRYFIYCIATELWFLYNQELNFWRIAKEAEIWDFLEEKLKHSFSSDLIKIFVQKTMKSSLIEELMNKCFLPLDLRPFGVFNLKNKHLYCFGGIHYDLLERKVIEEKPENLVFRYSPVKYDKSKKEFPKILDWLNYITEEDNNKIQVFRAWINLVLLSNSYFDLNHFLETNGTPGSGKTLASNLVVAIVGPENVFSTNLKTLSESRFEKIQLRNKSLILFQDQPAFGGDPAMLKALTGGEGVWGERKHKNHEQFKVRAGIWITSNNPITFLGGSESSLRRRKISFNMNRAVLKEETNLLNLDMETGEATGILANELPAFLNWILDMNLNEAKDLLVKEKWSQSQNPDGEPLMWFCQNIVMPYKNGVLFGKDLHALFKHFYPNASMNQKIFYSSFQNDFNFCWKPRDVTFSGSPICFYGVTLQGCLINKEDGILDFSLFNQFRSVWRKFNGEYFFGRNMPNNSENLSLFYRTLLEEKVPKHEEGGYYWELRNENNKTLLLPEIIEENCILLPPGLKLSDSKKKDLENSLSILEEHVLRDFQFKEDLFISNRDLKFYIQKKKASVLEFQDFSSKKLKDIIFKLSQKTGNKTVRESRDALTRGIEGISLKESLQ